MRSLYKWSRKTVWLFPLIVLLALLVLSTLKLHGSSIGIYHSTIYGDNVSDPDLIYGRPQPIRSDEWRIWTPITALQAKTGFPAFNDKLAGGRDVAIVPDAPTKDWLTIFRPQNLAFLIVPFDHAFAFRWWFGLSLVLIASYFMAMRLLGGNKKVSILLAIAFSLSPFLFWWYQSALLVPLAYSLFMMMIGTRLIKQEKIKNIKSRNLTNAIYLVALSYLGASFVLFLYVPFLLPFAIVVSAYLIGVLLNERFNYKSLNTKALFMRLGMLFCAIVIVGTIVLVFSIQHKEMIEAISNSEYPGQRSTLSGPRVYSPSLPILGSFLNPLLQSGFRGANYSSNQSEASNFILLLPFLILPGIIFQIAQYRRSKKIDFAFLAIQIVALLFLLRISVRFADKFYNLLQLDRVPHNRLLAGIGLVGFIQLLYIINYVRESNISRRKLLLWSAIYGLLIFIILMVFGRFVMDRYPLFIDESYLLVGLAIFFTAIIVALLSKRVLLASALLMTFTLFSSFRIMPIYHDVNFLENSEIIKKIEQVSEPGDNWVVLDSQNYENLPIAAGRGQIGGYQIYTDLDFWRQIDKDGNHETVYNRQGHALFLSNTLPPDPEARHNVTNVTQDLELVKSNLFKVRFSCSDFTYQNIDYVLITQEISKECTELIDQVTYPGKVFYIYKIVEPTS